MRLVGMWRVALFSGLLALGLPVLLAAVEPRVRRREAAERLSSALAAEQGV
jgi:type II secretory pathway pseudopilin PulG